MLVRDYLIAQASRSPERLAYIDGSRRFTWAQTADRAMRLAGPCAIEASAKATSSRRSLWTA